MKIYTKKGDDGKTMLFGGGRVPKHHIRIEAYGTIDELNSFIGLLKDLIENKMMQTQLKQIQDELFSLGSVLATNPDKERIQKIVIDQKMIERLEKHIDEMEEELPALQNFILPGGHQSVSVSHICRTVCRRAERNVSFLAENGAIPKNVLEYLNRLSDYLFVLGRKLAQDLNTEEIVWKNPTE